MKDITIEKKNKREFNATDYVVEDENNEVIYEGTLNQCGSFLQGYYYTENLLKEKDETQMEK